jgi:AcrR family transcriptional regulator
MAEIFDQDRQAPRWRLPKQARSRERFDRILDAAAALFAEVGYDVVTADEIAARADTSVGGLYRFFPDKLAVFHALADRYFNQLQKLFIALHTEETLQLPLEDYINHMIDTFDQFVVANPGYRAVFAQSRLIPTEILSMDTSFNQATVHRLADFFAVRNPLLEPDQRNLIAIVSVEVGSVLDLLSLTRDLSFRQQILIETKKLLIAYLKQYFPD